MGETHHIPVASYATSDKEERSYAIECQTCDETLSLDWINNFLERSSKFERALQDLITIIELDEFEWSPDPMVRITAREQALQAAKDLLPEVFSEPDIYLLRDKEHLEIRETDLDAYIT